MLSILPKLDVGAWPTLPPPLLRERCCGKESRLLLRVKAATAAMEESSRLVVVVVHVEPRDTNDGGGASATSVPPPPLARPLPTQVLRKRLGAELDCGKASRLLDRGVVPRVSGGASPLLLRRAAAAAAAEAEVDMPDMVWFASDEGRVVVADDDEEVVPAPPDTALTASAAAAAAARAFCRSKLTTAAGLLRKFQASTTLCGTCSGLQRMQMPLYTLSSVNGLRRKALPVCVCTPQRTH
jgi:pyruvate/2-oxoglutarate dehydrogenase complex dihydrolipoamide acyltransferase (E2) component